MSRLALLASALLTACASPEDGLWEEDLGPLEPTIDERAKNRWPGSVLADGARQIPLINGFQGGMPSAYWFVGLAPHATADMFWFCREDESECPLDAEGKLNLERTIGGPVFSRMPGEQSYSPYWWIKVIRVPDDYQADDLKSVFGIERAIRAGRVSHEWYHFDYGGSVGPQKAIEHSVLVLEGTQLQGNGDPMIGQPDVASARVPLLVGWHKQYQVHFYDFTDSEGVLIPDSEEGIPIVPTGEMYVMFRDCLAASQIVCDTSAAMRGSVSERGLGQDLTGDGDTFDTNNILVPRSEASSLEPGMARGWGLWTAMEVTVAPEYDEFVELIDTTTDQSNSAVKSLADLNQQLDANRLSAPTPLAPLRVDQPIPGDQVLFDCPMQVQAPYSGT